MNIVLVSKSDLTKYYSQQKLDKRVERWFFLGLSVAKLVVLPNGSPVVRALCQLLEEYEHFNDNYQSNRGGTEQKKLTSAPMFKGPTLQLHASLAQEPVKATIVKLGKQVVYEYLQVPSMLISPSEMDYCEVVYSLCEVLGNVYCKFIDPAMETLDFIHEAFLKLDRKIMQLVIAKMAQDLTLIASPILKTELNQLVFHCQRSQQTKRSMQLEKGVVLNNHSTSLPTGQSATSVSVSTSSATVSSVSPLPDDGVQEDLGLPGFKQVVEEEAC